MSASVAAGPQRASGRLALLGSAGGLLALAVVAGSRGSTIQPPLIQGAGAHGPISAMGGWLGLDTASFTVREVAVFVASAGAAVGFLWLLLEAWRGNVSARTVVWYAVAAHVAVLVSLPLLYSRDLYSYAIYGRMLSLHGANPYVTVPQAFSGDPFFPLVGTDWVRTTSVYGPVFTWLSAAITSVVRSPSAVVASFRATAAIASLGTTLLVAGTVGRLRPSWAAFSVVLVGLNPAVLFHTVAGGHNDALIGLSVAAGLALLARGRPLMAVAVLTLGALVKLPAIVPLTLLVAFDVGRSREGARLRSLASHFVVIVGVAIPFAATVFSWSNPTFGVARLSNIEGWLSPASWIRRVLTRAAWNIWRPLSQPVNVGVRGIFALSIALLLLALVLSLTREPGSDQVSPGGSDGSAPARDPSDPVIVVGATWAWGLLGFALLGPLLRPSYMLWLLPVAWLLPASARRFVIVLCALQSVSFFAVEQSIPGGVANIEIAVYLLAPLVLILSIGTGRDLIGRLRAGTPLT